ncbi:hypothetical protein [Luteolibacter sp. AS25]|uniref:hypothetical protein n=1 Tax=Luteolibacter sp. AS25 TaxID=3135776 RepID=UPI00398BB2A1
MIPDKKKTPEEIAALREELGIPDEMPRPPLSASRPLPAHSETSSPAELPRPAPIQPAPVTPPEPDPRELLPKTELRDPVVHLGVPAAPTSEDAYKPAPVYHSLRKHELPLAPAPETTHKTELPTQRHDPRSIAQIRKREELGKLNQPSIDPVAQLRKITAHPVLLGGTYLLSLIPSLLAYRGVHFITPLCLLALCSALALYIFLKKKRSRHHAAILAIIILMTLAFGGLHYAPLFNYGS